METLDNNLTFPWKPGTGSMQGNRFEIKMTLLIFIRILNMGVKFKISSNDKRYGLFDDIVLSYENGSHECLLLVQLKHKTSKRKTTDQALAASSGDFSLNEYYNSFCNIINSLPTPEHTYYILYSNRHYRNHGMNSQLIPRQLHNLLSTGGKESCESHFSTDDHKEICALFSCKPNASDFLDRFLFLSGQANEDELDELIKLEISKYFNIPGPGRNIIHTNLYKEIETWYEEITPNKNYLTEQWPILQTIKKSLENQDKLTQVEFSQSELGTLATKLYDDNSDVIHISYSDGTEVDLFSIKILQAIKIKDCHNKVHVSSLSDPTEDLSRILQLWKHGHFDILVCYYYGEAVQNIHIEEEIVKILKTMADKKLVLISAKDSHQWTTHLRQSIESWKEYEDTCSFSQLCENTQNYIWNIKITFQGEEVVLQDIDKHKILGSILVGNVLSRFLRIERGFTIGKPLQFNNDGYVLRRLERNFEISEDLLCAEEIADNFVVVGCTSDELSKLTRGNRVFTNCVVGETSGHYTTSPSTLRDLSQDTEKIPEHLLRKEAGSFIWEATKGAKDNIYPYIKSSSREIDSIHRLISKSESCQVREMDILTSQMKVVLVTGDPGMGKSELLSHVASEAKKIYPHTWILRINLCDFIPDLQRTDSESVTQEFVTNLLKSAAALTYSKCPEIADALLMDAIDNTGNVIVILDAFDEVVLNYTNTVIAIISILLDKKVSSTWISSRKNEQVTLELQFETRAFVLMPLTESEQREFLVKLWGKHYPNLHDLHEIARVFLIHIQNICPSQNGNSVSSIPLFLRMLADIYPEGKYTDLNEALHLADIYDMFVKKKFVTFFKDLGMDISIPGVRSVTMHYQKRLMKLYALYAARIMGFTDHLDGKEREKIEVKFNKFLEELKRGDERVGLLDSLVKDSLPRFIHYSFLEYFAALWLIAHKENNLNHIRGVMLDFRLNFLRNIFNRTLCRSLPLHSAVLANDPSAVNNALKTQDVNAKDDLERTALSLAMFNSRLNDTAVLEQLLTQNVDTEVQDRLFESTPVYQAAQLRAWSKVKLLLQKGAKVQDNIAKEKDVQDLIKEAIKNNYCQDDPIVYKAFEINWNIFDSKDEANRDSLLHLAVRCQNVEWVKMLLDKGAQTASFNKKGITPLSECVLVNNTDIAELILGIGSFISYPCLLGPLYYACFFRQEEMVSLLLRKGVNLDSQPVHRVTALHGACDALNMWQCVVQEQRENISDYAFSFTSVSCTGFKPNLRIVRKLLEHAAEIDARDPYGRSPLFIAVECKMTSLVKLLLDHNANVNIPAINNQTPLACAAYNGDEMIVKLLLDKKADSSVTDNLGRTPLHHAAKSGHTRVLELLLCKGADVTVRDFLGLTPLHVVASTPIPNALRNFKLLIKYNADINEKNKFNMTPLHAAWIMGNKAFVEDMMKEDPNAVLDMLNTIDSLRIDINRIPPQIEEHAKYLSKMLQKIHIS